MDVRLEAVGTRAAVREWLQAELRRGEAIVVYAEGLLRVVSPLFDKCSVVLTSERLIIFAPGWPWGFKVRGAEPRSACGLVKHKSKFDGSMLIVLRQGEEVRCLYFARSWREQGDLIRSELADREESLDEFEVNVEALRELGGLRDTFVPPLPDEGRLW